MTQGKLTQMDPGAFLSLVVRCGLQLEEVDLAQLARRKLVAPWERGDGESRYTALHLYVVAEYLRAVRPTRHPWSTRPADRTIGEVSELNEKVNQLLELAFSGDDVDHSPRAEELFIGLERFLARIDPFGPMGEVFDLLHPRVVSQLRNSGRLYVELKGAVSVLSRRLQVNGKPTVGIEEPKTEQMFGVETDTMAVDDNLRSTQVIGEQGRETSEAAQEAIDEVVTAATADKDDAEEPKTEVNEFDEQEMQATQVIEVRLDPEIDEGLREDSSEPIVLLEEDAEEDEPKDKKNGFSRGDEETRRIKDLDARLKNLGDRRKNKTEKKKALDTKKDAEESGPAMPPPSPEERIADLNRRRQEYMKAQAWDKLVALYEDGIELFADAEERQQVFLVLATLYEGKLKEKEKAFGAFARAWEERDATAGRDKAMAGIKRLGKTSGVHDQYIAWLQDQLTGEVESQERKGLQKDLARAFFADEQFDRAFLCYASFLAEDPNRNISAETLEQLGLFGEHVDGSEVADIFEDFRSQELDPTVRKLVEEFAPVAEA